MISIFDEIERYFAKYPQWKKAFSLAIGQPKTIEEAQFTLIEVAKEVQEFCNTYKMSIYPRVFQQDWLDYVKHLEALQPTYLA